MLRHLRLLLMVVPLAGCDLLFQIQHVDPVDGGDTSDAPVRGCDGTNMLHSSFADDVDLARGWDKNLDSASGTAVQIVDRTVAVTTGVPAGYAEAVSNKSYAFRRGMMQVKLVEPFKAPNTEMYMMFELPTVQVDRCYIGIEPASNDVDLEISFVCKNNLADVGAPKYLTFDPVAHHWLRMQQTGATSVTFFTSVDGMMWTPRHEIDTLSFAFDSVHLVLGAGSYSGATAPQSYTVRFDDFDFCGP